MPDISYTHKFDERTRTLTVTGENSDGRTAIVDVSWKTEEDLNGFLDKALTSSEARIAEALTNMEDPEAHRSWIKRVRIPFTNLRLDLVTATADKGYYTSTSFTLLGYGLISELNNKFNIHPTTFKVNHRLCLFSFNTPTKGVAVSISTNKK